jgi:hypothetical protein
MVAPGSVTVLASGTSPKSTTRGAADMAESNKGSKSGGGKSGGNGGKSGGNSGDRRSGR